MEEKTMETTTLGNTGLETTRIGLGAQTVGGLGYGTQDFSQSLPAVKTCLQGGGRFIDTARGYGVSEIYVGKALMNSGLSAESVTVCSKSGNIHPPCTRADLETSRFCLQRDYIDIYYVHVPPENTQQFDKILDAYSAFKSEKLIRFVGLSCKKLNSDKRIEEVYRWIEDPRADVIQFPYNPLQPEIGSLIAAAADRGIGTVVRGTVAAGILDDRIMPGHRFTDIDNDWRAKVDNAAMQEIIQIVQQIKQELVTPPYAHVAQLSQKWALCTPGVDVIIGGGGCVEEVRALLDLDSLPPLPRHFRQRLEEMSMPIRHLL